MNVPATWRRLPLRRKAIAVLLPLLLALLAASGGLLAAQQSARQTNAELLLTLKVQHESAELLRLMIDAETGVRGYLLDGRQVFLEPFNAARPVVMPGLQRLQDLVVDEEAARLLQQATTLAGTELARLQSQVDAGPGQDLPALRESLLMSKQRMDALRAVLESFDEREDELLAQRLIAQESSQARETRASILFLIAGLALGLGGMLLLLSNVSRRLRQLTLARGGLVEAEGDEIDRLDAALDAAEASSRASAAQVEAARSNFERLLSASPVVTLEAGPHERTFTWVSDNCTRLFGWERTGLLGDRTWWDRVTSGGSDRDAGSPREVVLLDGQGRERNVLVTTVSAGDRVTAYLLDLTAQRQAEASSAAAAQTVDGLFAVVPDVITLLDGSGRVERSSLALPARARAGDLHGMDVTAFDLPEDAERSRRTIDELLEGRMAATQFRHRVRLPGVDSPLWVESHARRMSNPDGSTRGIAMISRDVSEQVAAEAKLQQAQVAAEQASSAKTEFLARMSHELRTPLNAVLGFTQLLERSRLDDEQRESVQQVLRAGQHLLGLINDVLDLSQVESGDTRLIMEAVEVSSAVRSAADLVRPLADQVRARLVVSGPDDVHVLADRRRLSQVLINLLGNALKYSGSTPHVEIRWTNAVEGQVRLTVADRGPGIAPELLSRLFVPFDRLDAEGTSTEGSGVGLSLSKQLVEAMAGELRVETEVGQGTAFTLALGAAECVAAAAAAPVAAQQGEAAARSTTLICVEDNPVNLALVRQALRGRPHLTLLTSLRGDQGLDLVRQRLPDLVLLDSNLPGLSGQEVLNALKQDPRTSDIPVVVLSADARPEGIAQMMQAGARHYLTKPLDLRELLEVVDSLTVPSEA